ncbi:MAG TPA: superoxide dismutase family protein [Candidatus Egerieisoma faecipullorum]|uniref:Superoxide dismutase family protein n=1 Tax=Candidatus Egerieisoma faecipullorum TaxID=2840963 RepID=A0A9D1L9Z8_9CLOT|nr:superoxide dismutase family protein [Candidatus Egerieisoma faecipullorum]
MFRRKKKEENQPDYAKYAAKRHPDASAALRGSAAYPNLRGKVSFYQVGSKVLVTAAVEGFPNENGKCLYPVYAMHIHTGASCTGNIADPFADTGSHYNPNGCAHPYHAGDLPPLFSNKGSAWSAFVTDRFTVREIINRTVVIHERADDFKTQPSGDSGKKIACGVIV